MAQLSKQALIVENNTSFPNNNTNYITPAILRSFNTDMIDSLVDENTYNVDSASWNSSISNLNAFTASASGLSTGSLLITASATSNVITFTKGDASTFSVTVATGSGGGTSDLTSLNAFTSSQLTINTAIGASTSSLNAFTASQDTKNTTLASVTSSLNSATASLFTSASLSLTTASFSGNTLSFRKGDGTTFGIVIPDVSGSGVPAGTISGSAQITALGFVSSSVTASSLTTASVNVNVITFTKGDGTTFNLSVAASGSVTPGTVSGSAQIVQLGFLQTSSFQTYTSSIDSKFTSVQASTSSLNSATASLFTSASLGLTTASVAGQILQFRKGDATTFNLTLPTGSGTIVTGSYAQFYDTTTQSGSANVAYALKFPQTAVPDGIILSGSTGMQVGAAGVYNIAFSLQASQGAGAANLNVWFKKNGTNISNSDTQWTLPSNTKLVPVVNILDQAALGDIYEIWWKSDSGNTTFSAIAAGVDTPEVPSAIATIFRVDVGGGTNVVTTGSFNAFTSSMNAYTASNDTKWTTLQNVTSSLNAATASLFTSASLALTTASFNTGTRNLTFTKGDTTTFSVNIPDVSGSTINTGSFATTGSNTFTGDNTFTGLVSITDLPSVTNYIITGSTTDGLYKKVFGPLAGVRPMQLSGSNYYYDGIYMGVKSGSAGEIISEIAADTIYGPTQVWTPNRAIGIAGRTLFSTYNTTSSSFEIQANVVKFTNNSYNGDSSGGQSLIIPIKSGSAGQVLTDVLGNGVLSFTTPTGGINTGSFATTGSNTFIGNQVITGSLIQSSSNSITTTYGNAVGTYINNRVEVAGGNGSDSLTARLWVTGTDNAETIIGRSFISVDTLLAPSLAANINAYASTGSAASFNLGVYDDPNFNTDVEIEIKASSSGIQFGDWDNGSTFAYVPFMTIQPNVGNNPAPLFTRGLQVTGSTNIQALTASLAQGYTWVGNASGKTSLVATSSFGGGGGAAFPYTGSAEITGSLGVTGSISGFVNTLTISSNTASLDFSRGNFFTLQLVSGSITHLTAANIKPGQTINLLVKTDSGSAAATGSLTFSPTYKFAGGIDYTPTAITASQDLVSFVTFDTTQIFAAQVKNLS